MTRFSRWSAADFSEIVQGFGAFPQQDCTGVYTRALLAKCVSQLASNEKWVPLCIACRNGKLRCGYSPDLLAILQGNPGRPTPDFASVHALTVLAIPTIILHGMNRSEGGLTK